MNSNHEASIESIKSTLSQSMRSAVGRKIVEQKKSVILRILLGYILISFFGMIIIVTLSYFLFNSKMSKYELSSRFSWWQDLVSNDASQLLRLNSVHVLISQGTFSFSTDPAVIALDKATPIIIDESLDDFLK